MSDVHTGFSVSTSPVTVTSVTAGEGDLADDSGVVTIQQSDITTVTVDLTGRIATGMAELVIGDDSSGLPSGQPLRRRR